MPDLRINIAVALLVLPLTAKAAIITPGLPPRSVGLGLSTLHVEQPDSNTEQRYRWDLHFYQRLPWDLRLHNRLGVARDTRPRADSLQIHHHFHELASALQWTGTKLFRLGLGAGPLLLIEQTMTRVQVDETKERSNARLQLGAQVEAELDYAFNATWELALVASWQFRPAVNKRDFAFGVSLQMNLGRPGQEAKDQEPIVAPHELTRK